MPLVGFILGSFSLTFIVLHDLMKNSMGALLGRIVDFSFELVMYMLRADVNGKVDGPAVAGAIRLLVERPYEVGKTGWNLVKEERNLHEIADVLFFTHVLYHTGHDRILAFKVSASFANKLAVLVTKLDAVLIIPAGDTEETVISKEL